jgi:hypothetical protein
MSLRKSRSKSAPRGLVERRQLLRREHARHQLHVHAGHHHVRRVAVGHLLLPVAEPALHEPDLVALRDDDPLAQRLNGRAGAVDCAQPAMSTACA